MKATFLLFLKCFEVVAAVGVAVFEVFEVVLTCFEVVAAVGVAAAAAVNFI